MNAVQDKVFLSIGANLGNCRENIQRALVLISELKETGIAECSPFYRTRAWGKTDQPDFLNIAVEIKTPLAPLALMEALNAIEKKIGRIREVHWGPRIIDIDILFYGEQVVDLPVLKVPHPELQNRRFVLVPLCDIAADFVHPVLKKKMQQLLSDCSDETAVNEEGPFF